MRIIVLGIIVWIIAPLLFFFLMYVSDKYTKSDITLGSTSSVVRKKRKKKIKK